MAGLGGGELVVILGIVGVLVVGGLVAVVAVVASGRGDSDED